jgi:hypothetical protein
VDKEQIVQTTTQGGKKIPKYRRGAVAALKIEATGHRYSCDARICTEVENPVPLRDSD